MTASRPKPGVSPLVRLPTTLLVAFTLAWAAVACDDNGGISEPAIDLSEVDGLYIPVTMSFKPQGAAPVGDILAALAVSGIEPTLNVALNGTFQVPYRDPVTGEFRTLAGTVQVLGRSLSLTFATAGGANQVLMPRSIVLAWDEETEALHFTGSTDLSRVRLQQLFPDLYGQEPWAGETIPGVLTLRFERVTAAS